MKLCAAIVLTIMMSTSHGKSAVQLVGIEGRVVEPSALHLVGGQVVDLQLQIASTTPSQMSVRASLYELATGIAAPIAKELPVVERLAFDGSSIRLQKLAVTLPDVRAATTMELRFVAKTEAGETWQPAGTARLVVYPADIFVQIRTQLSAAASRAGIRLVVLGDSSQLKPVLREIGLPFEEADAASDTDINTLYLAECSADAARALIDQTPAAARLLIFTRDSALPPGVYWTERRGGFMAKITLPVFADLGRAPERQMLFLTLFQRALRTFPNSP
jgi:hypothetical protein